ncbi:MAG: haloacid dehalogenase [Gammaproteobacteria bacterium]|nr:MAG: haloacid dehalogenase [Gammaproteobacteria bacterium]
MDGTLLDLHFDDHFWQEHVPRRYAELHGIDPERARALLQPKFRAMEGTLQWYCLDYWSRELGLDIPLLKQEIAHLIAVHPHVVEFLRALRRSRRKTVLTTNAHGESVSLKLARTDLAPWFDHIVSAHELGVAKESDAFWPALADLVPHDPERTLLVDDNLAALASAARYGIRHLRAVRRPSSRGPEVETGPFVAIEDFRDIMP